MVKLAGPGFDSATNVTEGCTTAGTRKLELYPWGFMGTPWGLMGGGGAMATYGDRVGTP